MIKALLGILGVFGAWFIFVFFKDFMKNKNNLENNSWTKLISIGFITDFFDTLGIGAFAPTTALLRGFKQTNDRTLPGTLNVSHTTSVITEAFIFMTVIEVDAVTLISMLAAATVGAWVGAAIISRFSEKKIQFTMAFALFITGFLMLAGKMGWMPGGGDAIGLTGIKLVIGIIGNFILGALMTAGIGLYAPCMALVYLLGMSAKVAFPIMMGSCAFLMPVASAKFVKEGAYDRKASMGITIGGVIGVIIAAYIVKSLPMETLKWLVIGVIFYTCVSMFMTASKNTETKDRELA
ncbi:sulfite exporter TauE/SafE family protein [Tepidibacter hydrothermalis]|uniref:Probable membrane transporter protein n=1 Tax=Tepidibacter hydrothermalis TaxID=3036126 RepID=A0ABY8EGV8_9FIRM|nr:sulfite exporter TauE/SafE family protein [Tepidibacter hydrothermalis]WFD12153.1 sulfite exporter TauE/SafE family protein [Tepidibacter hydrothermalis]